MLNNAKKRISGFTLVETMITVVILTVAALGLTGFLISIQYTAEENLYESTALTVALSTLEQMKGSRIDDLERSVDAPTFDLRVGSDDITLNLRTANSLDIPIVTNTDDIKTMPLELTPRVEPFGGDLGFWLSVEYEYEHPRNGSQRSRVLSCVRSKVPNF